MPVQLLDGHHCSRRNLVEANEDPVLEPHINSNGDDADEQHDVFLLHLNAVMAQEEVEEASPTCWHTAQMAATAAVSTTTATVAG